MLFGTASRFKMKTIDPRLIGVWHIADAISSVEYEIFERDGNVRVRATVVAEGEELEVSGIRRVGKWLEFRTFVRSNGFRAIHRVRCASSRRVVQQITTTYNWIRADPGDHPADAHLRTSESNRSKVARADARSGKVSTRVSVL